MNKKNRYIQHTNKEKINPVELFFLFYCQGREPEALYKRHRTEFLRLWKEHYPCTRPTIFWQVEHAESYAKLYSDAHRKRREAGSYIFSGLNLTDAKIELARLGELDSDEYEAEPRAASYRELKAAYFGE